MAYPTCKNILSISDYEYNNDVVMFMLSLAHEKADNVAISDIIKNSRKLVKVIDLYTEYYRYEREISNFDTKEIMICEPDMDCVRLYELSNKFYNEIENGCYSIVLSYRQLLEEIYRFLIICTHNKTDLISNIFNIFVTY